MPKGVSNKRYAPEFKKMVVETMLKEKLSYSETARQQGPAAKAAAKRGRRGSAGRSPAAARFAAQKFSRRGAYPCAVSPTITGKQIPNLRLWRNGYVQKGLYRHQRLLPAGAAGHHRAVAGHQARHRARVLSPADEKPEPRHDLPAVEHPHARVVRDGHEPARRSRAVPRSGHDPARRSRDHRRHGQGALAAGRCGHGARHRAPHGRGACRGVHDPGHQRHERL